jgi:hypothetical protein
MFYNIAANKLAVQMLALKLACIVGENSKFYLFFIEATFFML